MDLYIFLAKEAVENYVKNEKIVSLPDGLPEEFLKRRAGVFVTVEKKFENKRILRGCIGTYLPTKENIAQEIIDNAVAAAAEDYRFGPIQENELAYLSYTVYILNGLELVKNRETLNPKKYGIIVKTAQSPLKSGLLLPDLKNIDTVEKQIAIACQKAGIDPTKEKIIIYKFTAEKHNSTMD